MKKNGVLTALAFALALGAAAFSAPAIDTLTLKDGRVLKGEVVKELEGVIWFKSKAGGIESTTMFTPSEVKLLERGAGADAAAPPSPAGPAAALPEAQAPQASRRVPRAVVLSLGDGDGKGEVGTYMAAQPLKEALPALKKDNIDVVVLKVKSGGGALLEIQKISDVIENEYKKNFRVVGWMEDAISAAAMSTLCLEEIYMMPQGTFGACTGWHGDLVAVKDRDLEEVLYTMEKISARGNHNPMLMRAMQIMEPLSASVDEHGEVTFYQDTTSGKEIVSPPKRVLCFNARDAVRYKFARGIAADVRELGKLLGYPEIEWVGSKKPGYAYPVSRAEQMQIDFREKTFEDENRFDEFMWTFEAAVGAAGGAPKETKGKYIGYARRALDSIRAMVRNNENFALFKLGLEPGKFDRWVEEKEKILRDLAKDP